MNSTGSRAATIIVIDGLGIVLFGHRVASVYSCIVSGAPIPPAFFGSLQDLVDCELEYEASDDYPRIRPIGAGTFRRKAAALSVCPNRGRAGFWLSEPVRLDPWSFVGFTSCPRCGTCSIIGYHRGVRAVGVWVVR